MVAVDEKSPVPVKTPAEYNLLHKQCPFFDKHFVYAIINVLYEQKKDIFEAADLDKCRMSILEDTKMLTYMKTECEKNNIPFGADLCKKEEEVQAELKEWTAKMAQFLEVFSPAVSEEGLKEILGDKTVKEYFFEPGMHHPEGSDARESAWPKDVFDTLYEYATLQFSWGNYTLAAGCLDIYRNVMEKEPELQNSKKQYACLWGTLASHILVTKFKEAEDLLHKIMESIEHQRLNKHEEIAQRVWWSHWALFVLFKGESVQAFPKLVDVFLSDKNLQVIALAAPHLIRYVSYIAIVTKRLRPQLPDIASFIDTNISVFNDPLAMFLKAVNKDMDFKNLNDWLEECKSVCKADFFFVEENMFKDFEEHSRLLIFETFCRIHQEINIQMIAENLGMDAGAAEVWIVKLIQAARFDAKIDSEKNSVIMTRANEDIYHEVLEKTKNLNFRSMLLYSNLEKSLEDKNN